MHEPRNPISREELFKRFRNGAKPNEEDFWDLFNSCFNKVDEPRQEVVSNAGEYFYRPMDMSGQTNKIADNGSIILGGGNRFFSGVLNIFIPKGVRSILGFRMIGSLEYEGAFSPGPPSISLTPKLLRRNPDQINSIETLIFTLNETGSLDLAKQYKPVNFELSPNGVVSVSLVIMAKNNGPANGVTIHAIGVNFA